MFSVLIGVTDHHHHSFCITCMGCGFHCVVVSMASGIVFNKRTVESNSNSSVESKIKYWVVELLWLIICEMFIEDWNKIYQRTQFWDMDTEQMASALELVIFQLAVPISTLFAYQNVACNLIQNRSYNSKKDIVWIPQFSHSCTRSGKAEVIFFLQSDVIKYLATCAIAPHYLGLKTAGWRNLFPQ